MITINLYDYKRVIREVGIQKNLAMVVAVGMVSILLSCMIWMWQFMSISLIKNHLAEVEIQVAAATPNYNAVQVLKKRQTKYDEIIAGINALRSNQVSTTEILEDVGYAVPEGVWLTAIKQVDFTEVLAKSVPFLFIDDFKKAKAELDQRILAGTDTDKFIEVRGSAEDDQPVVHFLDQLRALSYVDAVVLTSSNREWIDNVPIQEFVIYCHFLNPEPEA